MKSEYLALIPFGLMILFYVLYYLYAKYIHFYVVKNDGIYSNILGIMHIMAVPYKDIEYIEATNTGLLMQLSKNWMLWPKIVKVTLKSGGTYFIKDNEPEKFARSVIIKMQQG